MQDLMLRSGQKLLEVCVSEAASHQSTAPVECPQCEQACRPIQKRGVNITTLCGKIRVQRWSVSCDGCYTNSPDGWKETKVGCMDRDYPQPQSSSDVIPSARTPSIRYVASRPDAAHFGKELYIVNFRIIDTCL